MTNAEQQKAEWRLAMMHAVLFWPGITISDGAFDVLRQVREYNEKHRKRKPKK